MVLIGCVVVLAAREASANCKMVINVDRSASMLALRDNGQSKCEVAQNAVLLILDAYWHGLDYDITQPGLGAVVRAEFDANCACPNCSLPGTDPTATAMTRLVQVREFRGDVMQPLWAGFIPVNDAYQFMIASSGWYNAAGVSLNSCPGSSTPMAQAMCRAARQFALGAPPAGEFRIAKTTTDGQENFSDIVPVDAGEARCRLPGDTEVVWRDRVMTEYTSRGIAADAVLWDVGGATTLLRRQPVAMREIGAEARGFVVGDVAPRSSAAGSPDFNFFTTMALSTGGRFQFVASATPVSSAATLSDGDQDGIPDFRDQCVGACATDSDRDGMPDANDVCPFLAEEGNSPARTDGCPDTDSDGIRNGIDQCPTVDEDNLAPFPRDGCPAAHWTASATPNLKTVDNGTACTSLNVISSSGAASQAKLNISGTHAFRSALRGTLAHNGVTVAAFPVGTFPASSGTFSFTNRPVPMAAGAAGGSWTLCIVDTDPFGDVGVLNSWSVHD